MIKYYTFLFTASIIFFSCGNGDKLDIDVSGIDVKIDVKRFDRDLKNAFEKGEKEVVGLRVDYPVFFELFNVIFLAFC